MATIFLLITTNTRWRRAVSECSGELIRYLASALRRPFQPESRAIAQMNFHDTTKQPSTDHVSRTDAATAAKFLEKQ